MKAAILSIALLLFLLLLAGTVYYLAIRFSYYFNLEKKWPLLLGVGLATIFGFGANLLFTNSDHALAGIPYVAGGIILGFLLYLGIMVVLLDLLSLLLAVPGKISGILALSMALLLSAFATWNTFQVQVREVDLKLGELEQEIRIMQWSDVHLGHLRGKAFVQELVGLSREAKADLVVITGDLYDGTIRLKDDSLEPLAELGIPSFAVEGNHDVYSGIEEVKEKIREAGVRVLSDEKVRFEELQIIGLNYMLADEDAFDMHPGFEKRTVQKVLPGIPVDAQKPLLLLHHAPYGISYAEEKGVDLYLAGHTHGGQLFPMTWVNKILFRYNRGLYKFGDMQVYVSEGAGSAGIPMRLGTRSSITLFKLSPE